MSLLGYAILVIGVSVLYAFLGVTIVRRLMHGRVQEGHNEVLAPLFLTAGAIYAVLIGFVVIAVWERYDAAKANVGNEASVLATMYRQTNGMPQDEQHQMRELLRTYTEAVVKDEWKAQATGGASPIARKAVADMYRAYATMNPNRASSSISVEFLRNVSAVAADRNQRTLDSEDELPIVLWIGLILGGAIVVGMSFILYMERVWPHALMSGVMAALIGTLLFVTLVLNHPFKGPMAIDAGAFEHALSVYASVDQGN